jgi:LysR family glycine cleavage system transcriptional activator
MYGSIPSLSALRAFEAVARLGSFTLAAAELNVTPSAVSHQVRTLEEILACRLLVRAATATKGEVTPSGARLQEVIKSTFSELDQCCAGLGGKARTRVSRTIVISAEQSISTFWVAPRVASVPGLADKCRISLVTKPGVPIFSRDGIDLAILRLDYDAVGGVLAAEDDISLFDELIFPVCAPSLLDKDQLDPARASSLERLPLLQHDSASRLPSVDWHHWFDVLNISANHRKMVYFQNYSQAYQAALKGKGVLLGRSPFIDSDLSEGRLVPMLYKYKMRSKWRYYLRINPSLYHDKYIKCIVEFFSAEAVRECR